MFLMSAGLGAILLLIYDLIIILRNLISHSTYAVAAEDLLYWTAAGILLFVRAYQMNQGILRLFLLLGTVLGAVICHQTISPYFVRFWTNILAFPVIMVKKSTNVLLFWCKRVKLNVYKSMRNRKKCGKPSSFRRRKGKNLGKKKK